jgi:hypothetical protein
MGSFIVTVVGANPEDQMLKYSSVSSLALPNPYFQTTDITALLKEQCPTDYAGSMSDYLRNECEYLCIYELKADQVLDIYDDHQNGHFIVDDSGDVVTVFERKNPLQECDGFVLGGGYAGFYFIKPGHTGIELGTPRRGTVVRPNTADKILKGSIDFERMMGEAAEYAAKHYDAFFALAAKHNNYLGDEFEQEFFEGTQNGTFPMYASTYDYNQEREDFIKLRKFYVLSSYAFIINGEINKKPHCIGPMSPEAEIAWLESVWMHLFSLPDDTVFALYQCHE